MDIGTRFEHFMVARVKDTKPEARTEGHDSIIALQAPKIAKLLSKKARILDVGCGQGPALEWFEKEGFFNVRGIALNQEDVDVCCKAGFDAKIGDMNDLGLYYDGYFDCIWARHVLEHSIAPFWTLTEFNRVLTGGGVLYVETPDPGTVAQHQNNRNHYSVLTWEAWSSLIDRAGFKILQVMELNLNTAVGPDVYHSWICRKKEA